MTLFRARQWGAAEWTLISITDGPDEEDESAVTTALTGIIGSALSTSSLHVQVMGEGGQWENIE